MSCSKVAICADVKISLLPLMVKTIFVSLTNPKEERDHEACSCCNAHSLTDFQVGFWVSRNPIES